MISFQNIYAKTMRKAIQEVGIDEKSLIETAGKITHKQHMKIRQTYKTIYGRDLMEDLKFHLTENYKKIMLVLFTDPIEYDVDNLYNAIKGVGTDEDCLIEILASSIFVQNQ